MCVIPPPTYMQYVIIHLYMQMYSINLIKDAITVTPYNWPPTKSVLKTWKW